MKRKLILALSLSTAFGMSAMAQDAAPSAAASPPESIIHIILNGGPLIVLIWCAILATSITMVTFIIQNILTLRREKMAPKALVDSLHNEINAGNYQGAWETCNANMNYLANVLKGGLERIGRGKEAVQDAIAEYALREATVLRTRNSYLSVIGVISPMIGLLGTVIGMMRAFAVLGASGIGDPRGLATSIGEVLMATASGLFIAIPAFISYYIFRNRAQQVIVYADGEVGRLLEEIPYEDLAGLRIGEYFNAGQPGLAPDASQSRRVSMALTTNCPVCNGAVTPGQNPCPHCGATLDWAA
ncbi:MAG TPA: MotA/TolQ/ExbB proton channel family protein [Chthoniobacteraceae bacterium]|nr:MotA/TolQ/ExbB proton channel family protein [Chthoniobacteraceae bacterium]